MYFNLNAIPPNYPNKSTYLWYTHYAVKVLKSMSH